MSLITDVLDWASDKVQSMTGEKERRARVEEIKITYDDFKVQVTVNVGSVNRSIKDLNDSIKNLNDFRATNISKNIELLGNFLGNFGNIKMIGEYAAEKSKNYMDVPEHRFISIEDYIQDIDWSKGDVFINSFFSGPIGMKKKTQSQNLSMQEQLNYLKLEAEQTILELKDLKFGVEQDKEIAELYILCIERIITFIERVIIPEIEVIEAFFQALVIKNKLIADNKLENIEFKNDLELIRNTQFQSHYLFVRNAFMFYVIACKIYNTPVLTNLFEGTTSKNDLQEMNYEKKVLEMQMNNVNQFLIFKRKEA